MLGSRREKFASIFRRMESLIERGAMSYEQRPLWYDVYKAFPPKVEPTYGRPVPPAHVRDILYQEDLERSEAFRRYQKLGLINPFKVKDDRSTLSRELRNLHPDLPTNELLKLSEEELQKDGDLIFLGTASGYPSPRRGASGLILRDLKSGSQWLFDCGEGTQIQAQKCRLVHMGRISNIFISHLHGDHVYGLPGLLCTIAQRGEAGDISLASSENATKKPCVNIYGPQGLRRFVRLALAISRTRMQYSYAVHELIMRKEHRPEGYEDWASLEADPERDPPLACELPGRSIWPNDDGFWINVTGGEQDGTLVHAVALKHAVPSLGWLVIKPDRQPSLRVDVARSLGVPDGKLMGVLKQGKPVVVNGQTVRPEQVLGVPVRGERVAIMGDSYDSQELERLVNKLVVQGTFPELAVDVLVHEATLEHGMAENAREKGHSTPIQVTSFAARLNVRLLILTHFSQRYEAIARTGSVGSITDLSAAEPDTVVPKKSAHKDKPSVQILLDEAKTVPFSGEIMLADDFAVIPVPTTKVKEPS
ncbi:unnamed protein product [Calicophoron daubneyi]|uniref:Small ribosomal subunit protein mS23 n=1 Tax=Calicophoron daubneyi TaxID=300641 RepID=A0AAV2T4J2_CALDB